MHLKKERREWPWLDCRLFSRRLPNSPAQCTRSQSASDPFLRTVFSLLTKSVRMLSYTEKQPHFVPFLPSCKILAPPHFCLLYSSKSVQDCFQGLHRIQPRTIPCSELFSFCITHLDPQDSILLSIIQLGACLSSLHA